MIHVLHVITFMQQGLCWDAKEMMQPFRGTSCCALSKYAQFALLAGSSWQSLPQTHYCDMTMTPDISIVVLVQANILESHGASWASQPLGSTAPSRELGSAIIHGGDLYIFGGTLPDKQNPPLAEFLMKLEPSTGSFEGMDMRVEDESDDEEDSLLDSYPMPVTGIISI